MTGKNMLGLLAAIILLVAAPLTITASGQTNSAALVAVSPERTVTACIDASNQTVLTALTQSNFQPKQDDTGFIYSLIGHDGPRSTDPASRTSFWGFWTGSDSLNFSNLGPSSVRVQSGKRYVFSFGDGSAPTNAPSFNDVCQPSTTTPPPASSPTPPASSFDLSSSITYLRQNFNTVAPNGQDWIALALGANGQAITVSPTTSDQVLSQARSVLALAAQNLDRASLVSQIEANFDGNQFGDKSQINDDVFAVLAIASSDPNWLANHAQVFRTISQTERADGSFGFTTTGDSDVDMTAAALWALKLEPATETSVINKAFSYLDQARHTDGSFGFQPNADSNIPSTSWALIAYNTYARNAASTTSYLETSRQADGAWLFSGQDDVISTAYATLALSGRSLPINGRASTPSSTNQPSSSSHTSTSATAGNSTTSATNSDISGSCSASASATASGVSATANATASCD